MLNSSESIFYDSPKSLDENYGFWNSVLLTYILLLLYWILLHIRAVFLKEYRYYGTFRFWEWHITGVIWKIFIIHDALLLLWCFFFNLFIFCHFFQALEGSIDSFYVLCAIFYIPLMMLTEFWFILISSFCIIRTYIGEIPSRTCPKLKLVAYISSRVIFLKYGLFLLLVTVSGDEWSMKETATVAFILQLPTQLLLLLSTLYHFQGYIFRKCVYKHEVPPSPNFVPFNLYGVFIAKIIMIFILLRYEHWSEDDANFTPLFVFLDHVIAAIVIQLSEICLRSSYSRITPLPRIEETRF